MEQENQIEDIELQEGEVFLESHSEQEVNDFIKSLDDDFDPDAEKPAKEDEPSMLDKSMVLYGIGFIEQAIKAHKHQDFSFDAEQVDAVANATVPLLKKYGGELPEWLQPYKEEIVFLVAVASLGFSAYMQCRALGAKDAEIIELKAKLEAQEQELQELKEVA